MNAKIIKTKQSLLDAFCQLAQIVPIEEITVTQLCQMAGVNRTTFYRYYSIPMDIITQKAEEMTAQALDSAFHPVEDTYEFMLRICNCYYENRKLLSLFLNMKGNLLPFYYDTMVRHFSSMGTLMDPVNHFIAGGVASTMMTWIIQGCMTPSEDVAKYICDCINKLSNAK